MILWSISEFYRQINNVVNYQRIITLITIKVIIMNNNNSNYYYYYNYDNINNYYY